MEKILKIYLISLLIVMMIVQISCKKKKQALWMLALIPLASDIANNKANTNTGNTNTGNTNTGNTNTGNTNTGNTKQEIRIQEIRNTGNTNTGNTNTGNTNTTTTYTVGGTITGDLNGGTIVLKNNGVNDLSRSSLGSFTFSTALSTGSTYNATIFAQPASAACQISNSSGTISASDISSISIQCIVPTYSVGGNITGNLNGGTIVLRNNGGNNLSRSSLGSFTFSNPLSAGSNYNATIFTQPASATCQISNASGTISSSNISSIGIECAVCGDGVKASFEGCDDGSATSGDGCSSSCSVEVGWTCPGTNPSICSSI
jgi:cysteine-rich repeat protein